MDDLVDPATGGRRRPFGVLFVAALRTIDALSLAAIGLGIRGMPVAGLLLVGPDAIVLRALDLLLAALGIIGVIGLLMLRRWGWTITMILVGIELAAKLIRYVNDQPDPLGLLLLVVTAFYLNQRSVRALASDYLDGGSRSR